MTGDGAFRYYDEGRAQKALLGRSIKLLEIALENMEPGKSREATTAKLDALKVQRDGLKTQPPEGRYVTWSLDEVTEKSHPRPWATKIVAEHLSPCQCQKPQ